MIVVDSNEFAALKQEVDLMIKGEGLDHIWAYFLRFCKSKELPYHNMFHTMCMMRSVEQAARYYIIPRTWKHCLIVAAMFHDYNHSGGEQDDATNINVAVDEFNYFWTNYKQGKGEFSIDRVTVERLIRVTQFPFTREPADIIEEIIRDADLLQMAEPLWFEQVILGLRQEVSWKVGQEITMFQILEGQAKFIEDNFQFYTDWGKERWNKPEVQARVASLRQMADLVK